MVELLDDLHFNISTLEPRYTSGDLTALLDGLADLQLILGDSELPTWFVEALRRTVLEAISRQPTGIPGISEGDLRKRLSITSGTSVFVDSNSPASS